MRSFFVPQDDSEQALNEAADLLAEIFVALIDELNNLKEKDSSENIINNKKL